MRHVRYSFENGFPPTRHAGQLFAKSNRQENRCAGSRSCKLSGMTRKRQQLWRPRFGTAPFLPCAGALLVALLSPAAAQDIRGVEVCTAEMQMERRTGCLQANVELLQQALTRLARETQSRINAAGRDLATAQAEIAALKATVEKLKGELAQMKAKAEPSSKK
jgi:hypothetical protein